MAWMDCNKTENQTPQRALRECEEAIRKVHAAFGAPGFFGYGTAKGDALQHLYACLHLTGPALKDLEPADGSSE